MTRFTYQKILQAYERRLGSQRGLAHLLGVSLAVVENVLRQQRRTETIAPKLHAGGQRRRLAETTHGMLRQWVHDEPALSPIEPCGSKLKTLLRAAQVRTLEAREAAIEYVLAEVTPSDAHGWFRHCGYALR